MMRLADVTRMGPALAQMRGMLGMSRREAARQIAAMTGRSETSVNAQLYSWECEPGSRYHRQPDLASLVPYLLVLGLDVCLDFKIEESGVRTWPRLLDPPEDMQQVVSDSGTLWTRMGRDGHYWSAKGWEQGVSWAQVLRWGPVTEVKGEEAARDDLGPHPGGEDPAGRDDPGPPAGG